MLLNFDSFFIIMGIAKYFIRQCNSNRYGKINKHYYLKYRLSNIKVKPAIKMGLSPVIAWETHLGISAMIFLWYNW